MKIANRQEPQINYMDQFMNNHLSRKNRRQMERLQKYTEDDLLDQYNKGYEAGKKEAMKLVPEAVEREWNKMNEDMKEQSSNDAAEKVLTITLAVPVEVLAEQFGWKPPKHENDTRSKMLRFSEAVTDKVNEIFGTKHFDNNAYRDQIYEKYGVRFDILEEEKESGSNQKMNKE